MAETKGYDSEKIVKFDGQDSGWREWSAKVKATGQKKGWYKMLEKQVKFDPDATEVEEMKLVQLNNAALYFLTMPCGEKAFPYVENVNGDAYTAWNNLLERFYN